MFKQFGLDMFSALFTATVNGIDVTPKSVWIGEMSITGVVPDGDTTIDTTKYPYSF